MKAEYLKIRSLPTPRWCLIAMLGFFLIGLVCTSIWGIGSDRDITDLTIGFPMTVASIVFGVWLVGVEYGQKTMRQVLTADPRRGHLILSKLIVGTVAIFLTLLVLYVLSVAVFGTIAAIFHGQHFSGEFLIRSFADNLLSCLIFAVVGGAFALVAASMAGGITFTLVFIFILNTAFAFIPKVEDYTFGVSISDLSSAIRGPVSGGGGDVTHGFVVAALITLAWIGVIALAGFARFWESDVK